MRSYVSMTVALLVCATPGAGQDAATYHDTHARDVVTRTRMAVGGGHVFRLSALVMRGSATTLVDGSELETAVEIRIVLPDCYLRIERAATSTRRSGYCGSRLLSAIEEDGRTIVPPASMTRTLLRSERARLVRLLLGAAAYVSPELPLTFRSVAQSVDMVNPNAAPQPSLSVDVSNTEPFRVEVTGSSGFAGQLVVSSAMLPNRIEFTGAGRTMFATSFTSRRDVAGLKLPFRITTTRGDIVTDDLILHEILVNPELSRADLRQR